MKIEEEWRMGRAKETEGAMEEGDERQAARAMVKEVGMSADDEEAKEEEKEQWVAKEEGMDEEESEGGG